MQTVHLRDIKFFAFHGVYDEEKFTGNEFEVNLSVVFDQGTVDDDLARTVDYVHLFKILNIEMNQPRTLLETVAEKVIAAIFLSYPFVKSISIDIWKLNPPIEQFDGKVGISLSKTFASE